MIILTADTNGIRFALENRLTSLIEECNTLKLHLFVFLGPGGGSGPYPGPCYLALLSLAILGVGFMGIWVPRDMGPNDHGH